MCESGLTCYPNMYASGSSSLFSLGIDVARRYCNEIVSRKDHPGNLQVASEKACTNVLRSPSIHACMYTIHTMHVHVNHSGERCRQQALCLAVTRSSTAGRHRRWQIMVALVQGQSECQRGFPRRAFMCVHENQGEKKVYARVMFSCAHV
jgi:hypothetical protein